MTTRIVLLDDNPQDRLLAKRALGQEFTELEVTEPRDRAEFQTLLPRLAADIVITDYQLRWSDGLAVLAAVREAGYDIPVIMFTHTGSEEIAAAGLRAGLTDYIVKAPTHFGRLAHAVRLAIQNTAIVRRERESRVREREALRAAEEALRVKDEFLATLSHELRTPLNAISGWVQIIKSIPEPERLAKGLSAIERNATALRRLIEDLVDASRMVNGKLALEVRPTDARLVVEAALDSVRPTAQEKGVHLEVRVPSVVEPISGDPDRLQQIVWNLLSNAVKFTPAGGRVMVILSAGASTVELRIADTGPGIRADFLPRVFEPFSQQDPSTTRAQGGLGLGLSIVRHLVELHGGSVAVDSVEGQGAEFTLLFPTIDAVIDRELPSSGKTFARRLEGVRALVVDDDRDGRDVIGQILEDEGAVVTATHSAAEGYQQLRSDRPHVLICDIAMPDEDGLAFMRRIRADASPEIASVPAVAVTAYARDIDRLGALAAGYQFHLPKPVAATDLVETVGFLTNRKARIS